MFSRVGVSTARVSVPNLVLAAIALSVLIVHWAPGSWSDTSRMATVQALVEHGTFVIDRTDFVGMGDKVFIDGRFYSDKPPFPSMIGAVVYFPLYHLGMSLSPGGSAAYYLITLFTMKGFWLAALLCFYRTLRFTELDDRGRLFLTGALALGSLMLPWTAVFNNHGLAASFVAIGFCAFVTARHGEKPFWAILLSGLFFLLSAVSDVPTGAFYAAFGILVVTDPALRRYTAAYVLPCLVTVVPYLLINYDISGSILPVQIHREYFDYPGSYFAESGRLSGVAVNGPGALVGYAWSYLFGRNGFVLYNPLLLIAAPMLVLEIVRRRPYRREAWAVAAAAGVIFLYYVAMTTNEGGWSFSIRWFVPFLPPFFFFLYAYLATATRRRKAVFGALAAVSVFFAVVGAYRPWSNKDINAVSLLANLETAARRLSQHLPRWRGTGQ